MINDTVSISDEDFLAMLINVKNVEDLNKLLTHPSFDKDTKENSKRIELIINLFEDADYQMMSGEKFDIKTFANFPVQKENLVTKIKNGVNDFFNDLNKRIYPIKASSGFIAKTKSANKKFTKIEILTRQGKQRGE